MMARGEQIGLGAALILMGTLVSWWGVFAVRMVDRVQALSMDNAALLYAGDAQRQRDAIVAAQASTDRLLLMIEGEGTFITALLFLAVTFLYLMARRQRLARQRLERQLRASTHALKTPITGVRALLQTLRRGAVPEDLRHDLLDQGLLACDRLEHTAETLLAVQRAAAGRVRPERVDSASLVNAVLEHRARQGLPEQAAVDLGAPTAVTADPDAFRVILENLLDNARKYASGCTRISADVHGHQWALSVTDQGQGFDPGAATELFEPFAHRSSGPVTHGSGLGLSLSRELARAMGGELRAESPGVGRGAVFTVELKLARETGRGRRTEEARA